MTTIRCSHCAAPNRIAGQSLEAKIECAVCGRLFDVKQEGTELDGGRRRVVPDAKSVDLMNASSSFDPVDWSTGADEQRLEPYSIDSSGISNLGGPLYEGSSSVTLGEMPTADKQIDLSGILGPDEALKETASLDSELFVGGTDHTASALLPQPSPQAVDSTWRVRNDRGVVYEMSSTQEIRIWLHDRADWHKLRISKGDGPFLASDAYPELESDVADSPNADQSEGQGANAPRFAELLVDSAVDALGTPSQTADESGFDRSLEGHLELDFASASVLHRTGTSSGGSPPPKFAAPAGQFHPAERPRPVSDFSFRAPFITTFAVLGIVLLGADAYRSRIATTTTRLTALVEETRPLNPTEMSTFNAGIQAVDDGNFTTAAQTLGQLAMTTSEPEVFRYLAIALYKTNRNHEAKRALNRYRVLVERGKKQK